MPSTRKKVSQPCYVTCYWNVTGQEPRLGYFTEQYYRPSTWWARYRNAAANLAHIGQVHVWTLVEGRVYYGPWALERLAEGKHVYEAEAIREYPQITRGGY